MDHNVIDHGIKTKKVESSNILCFGVSGSLIAVTIAVSQYKS